ncbi:MAG: alpha-isopropylmalate synthase regulatory domain-containing protein [Candidatus Latescibacterota bacterium]
MRVSREGRSSKGRGISTDVIEASAKAYIDALNRLAIKMENTSPPAEGV